MKFSQKRKCCGCKAEPIDYEKKCNLGYYIESIDINSNLGYGYKYIPLEKCYKPLNNSDYSYLLSNPDVLKD